MATKKYMSYDGLTEYDALIKARIDSGDETVKAYVDTKTSDLTSTVVVDNKIEAHNVSTSAHDDIRVLITNLTTKLNNFLDVDDTTVDQLSEVITLINNNEGTLESLTTSKINVSDIIDNLTTNDSSKVLSAAQGVAIKSLIDALQEDVNDKADASSLANYYTKEEIDSYELITINDIDAICGANIQYASINEVTF